MLVPEATLSSLAYTVLMGYRPREGLRITQATQRGRDLGKGGAVVLSGASLLPAGEGVDTFT